MSHAILKIVMIRNFIRYPDANKNLRYKVYIFKKRCYYNLYKLKEMKIYMI